MADAQEHIADLVYHATDENLGAMLAELFEAGHDEVVIQHPTDGEVTVTRAEFDQLVADLDAKREDAAKKIQLFCTAMASAPVHYVDMDEGEFGVDIEGNALDIESTVFLPIEHYPDGIKTLACEFGTFVDESGGRSPLRIVDAKVLVGH